MNHRPFLLRAACVYCSASMLAGCAGTGQSIVKHDRQPPQPSESSATTSVVSTSSEVPEPIVELPAADDTIRLVDFSPTETAIHSDGEGNVVATRTSYELPPLTLESVEQMALANNPTLQQLSASASKAAGLRYQVGLTPNPTVGYFASQLADRNTDQQGLHLEQEFVRGDKLRLNRAVLNQTTQAQLWDLEVQRYRVTTDVRTRFYEAAAAQLQHAATLEFVKVATEGLEAAAKRKNAGEASQVEVLQARIQLREVELAAEQASAAFRGAWRDLVSVAGNPNLEPRPVVADLSVTEMHSDWDVIYQDLLQNSPEISAARTRVCEAQAVMRRQEVQPVPNVSVQMQAGYDNATDNGMLNLQIGAPVPVFNSNSGNISAAYADYCRATHDLKRIEMNIKARLARASQEYESAAAAVRKYDSEILPDARETLALSDQAYGAGEIDFLQMLIVRKTYFDANIRYIQAQGMLAQANAKIDGLLLTGGLDDPGDFGGDDGLRGQSFGGQ